MLRYLLSFEMNISDEAYANIPVTLYLPYFAVTDLIIRSIDATIDASHRCVNSGLFLMQQIGNY